MACGPGPGSVSGRGGAEWCGHEGGEGSHCQISAGLPSLSQEPPAQPSNLIFPCGPQPPLRTMALPQFEYSSAYLRRVRRVQFGVLSPEEIVRAGDGGGGRLRVPAAEARSRGILSCAAAHERMHKLPARGCARGPSIGLFPGVLVLHAISCLISLYTPHTPPPPPLASLPCRRPCLLWR